MAVVADTVNHFFHLPHQPVDPTESSRNPSNRQSTSPTRAEQSLEPSQSRRSMSHSNKSAAVPQDSQQFARREQRESPQEGLQTSHSGSRSAARNKPRPASPSLAGHDEPNEEMPIPGQIEVIEGNMSSSGSSDNESPSATDTSGTETPRKIKIRDLAHITELATSDAGGELGRQRSRELGPQYEISGMPIENIIEMVAGLLTKITTTNDVQHEHLHRQMPPPESNAPISAQTSSVLAFHGKNVPSITILSYLNRINKYCPTSYEVFLSLLVYFDRMTEKVNAGPIQSLREANVRSGLSKEHLNREADNTSSTPMEDVKHTGVSQTATPPLSGEMRKQQTSYEAIPGTPHSKSYGMESPSGHARHGLESDLSLTQFFVVDSFNIHRLVIAGVTCASKFFSDIFYTNSRYAKVGGLPLPELNHLELQFLLLNDFRLSVPVEELEAYGTMLVEFYAREVLAQHNAEHAAETESATSE